MSDWMGILFFVGLLVGAFVGVKALANQKPRTTEEFERNAAENTTMAGALLNALHDVTDPASQRSKEVRMQMKDGRYKKKRKEGKAGGEAETEES
jgi:Flp pilus assembly protein TadB